jgi:hypothetical protein
MWVKNGGYLGLCPCLPAGQLDPDERTRDDAGAIQNLGGGPQRRRQPQIELLDSAGNRRGTRLLGLRFRALALSDPGQFLIGVGDVVQRLLVGTIKRLICSTTRFRSTRSPMRGMIQLCCWHIDHLKQVRSFLNLLPEAAASNGAPCPWPTAEAPLSPRGRACA